MGAVDLGGARPPVRRLRDGSESPRARHFRSHMSAEARRHVFLRRSVFFKNRDAPVNPEGSDVEPAESTRLVKQLAREMGADVVGIANYDPKFAFADAEKLEHSFVIVFGMAMNYDLMIDIGPKSQTEVHRVYYRLDDLGLRLAQHIGAMGHGARLQPNFGELPLPAYAYLAGLGELGKHGSLISPVLGSSFRLAAVSTSLPLLANGPADYGIDEVCMSCNVCTRFCPGDAIKPEKKDVNGVTRWYVDTPACEPWFYKVYGCKICLMVCPLNAKGMLKEKFKKVGEDIHAAKTAKGLLDLIQIRSGIEISDDPDFENRVLAGDPHIPDRPT